MESPPTELSTFETELNLFRNLSTNWRRECEEVVKFFHSGNDLGKTNKHERNSISNSIMSVIDSCKEDSLDQDSRDQLMKYLDILQTYRDPRSIFEFSQSLRFLNVVRSVFHEY